MAIFVRYPLNLIFCLTYIIKIFKQCLSIYLLTHWWAEGMGVWSRTNHRCHTLIIFCTKILSSMQIILFQMPFIVFFSKSMLFMEWRSFGLIKHCHSALILKLNWICYGELQWILLFGSWNFLRKSHWTIKYWVLWSPGLQSNFSKNCKIL